MRKQKGFALLEVLVAIALIGIVAAGYLGAMNNATQGAVKTDLMDTARTLAEGQMEYVKTQPFSLSCEYARDPAMYDSINNRFINYPGYSATISATAATQRDANIQKITVTILYKGSTVTSLTDCRVK